MKKYFTIVGIFELLGCLVGAIVYAVSILKTATHFNEWVLLELLVLLAIIIFGPAPGILFIHYANCVLGDVNSGKDNKNFSVNNNEVVVNDDERSTGYSVGEMVSLADVDKAVEFHIVGKGEILSIEENWLTVKFPTSKGTITLKLTEDKLLKRCDKIAHPNIKKGT